MSDPLTIAGAIVLSVLGTARATRLWVFDAWPPVQWARGRFLAWAEQTREVSAAGEPAPTAMQVYTGKRQELTWRAGWAPLATCPFCVAPWFALTSLVWLIWSGALAPEPFDFLTHARLSWADAWWLLHAWFALSYLAAMVVVRDEPGE